MVEGAVIASKMLIKVIAVGTATMGAVLALLVLMNLAISGLVMDSNVFTDLVALVQVWCPFNLWTILAWLVGVSTAFIMFKLLVTVRNSVRGLVD